MQSYRTAVIFTCYNRKDKTVECLKSLKNQDTFEFDLFVCDDASTDGTSEAILALYPNANIVKGTGNLFWSKGMYSAMSDAIKGDYDYYLMINDDVVFKKNMWFTMFEPFSEGQNDIAVIGYTTDILQPNKITYGGRRIKKTAFNYTFGDIVKLNSEEYETCDVANWNCFLIDRNIIRKVGEIDPYYEHALGDYDYCLRLRKSGFNILVAKDTVGYCSRNSRDGTYLDSKLSRKKRIMLMNSPNGFPVKSWVHFCLKHFGIYSLRTIPFPIIKNYCKIILGIDIK